MLIPRFYTVMFQNADFTWERTASQDPDNPNFHGKKLTKGEIKSEKAAKKQVVKERKAPAKSGRPITASSGESIPSSPVFQDNASTLNEDEDPFKLHNMNFSIGRNELVAVIGGVGSGKSSLLAALAGDMRRTKGEVTMGVENRAFCPQYAWIQNASVRENILFGRNMDKDWYKKVVDACALQPDLDMLPHGDLTEIGERGITVSGGQKQRLNSKFFFSKCLIFSSILGGCWEDECLKSSQTLKA